MRAMNLREYIEKTGEARVAVALNVSLWTVRSWRLGTRTPRTKHANKLVAISGGEVTLAGIYAPSNAQHVTHT